jgi:16S rRNA C1402 (ribose-2'-O) methylase RsmI
MKRKITVTIQANVTLEATTEMEEILKAYKIAMENDEWDICNELQDKFESLLSDKIYEKMEGIKDIEIHDADWD